MTHIQHIISLHNLPVAADICRNVPTIVQCLDDIISPFGQGEQLSEPGHRWKIVFHPNALWVFRTRNACFSHSTIVTNNVFHSLHHVWWAHCCWPSLSASVKSVQLSSNIWHHSTMAERVIMCGPYTVVISRWIFVLVKHFATKKRIFPRTSTLESIFVWRAISFLY